MRFSAVVPLGKPSVQICGMSERNGEKRERKEKSDGAARRCGADCVPDGGRNSAFGFGYVSKPAFPGVLFAERLNFPSVSRILYVFCPLVSSAGRRKE